MKGLNLNSGSDAEVAELVDALASGASELLARGGSSPLLGTSFPKRKTGSLFTCGFGHPAAIRNHKSKIVIFNLFTTSVRTSMCEIGDQS